MWVQMNETQRSLWTFVRDNPGCTRGEIRDFARFFPAPRNSTWYNHLYSLTSDSTHGNIINTPRMIDSVSVLSESGIERQQEARALGRNWNRYPYRESDYVERHWALEGPFIDPFVREQYAKKQVRKAMEILAGSVAA